MSRFLIAMSGGIDSAVAAYLTVSRGVPAIGATMKLIGDRRFFSESHACCSAEDIRDAEAVAAKLGIPHTVLDFSEKFCECVVNPFVSAYENGCTPNPCVACNRYLKFETLYRAAEEMGCDTIVTGHYARVEYDEKYGRKVLKKAVYAEKDQSYVLYSLTREQIARTSFPLGTMSKPEVREIAATLGFPNADKPESQDICFVKDESYTDFIERYTGKIYPCGNFVDKSGNILGTHKGIIRYTVGQHKKLGISSAIPYYVVEIRQDTNEILLGEEKDLYNTEVRVCELTLSAVDTLEFGERYAVKIRYRQKETPATVISWDGNRLVLRFDEPQRAVTPGQSVVLYDGDTVIGGGIIEK